MAKRDRVKKAHLLRIICALYLSFSSLVWAQDIRAIKVSFLKGDYQQVIIQGSQLLGQGVINEDLYYILGLSYLKTGNYDKADALFDVLLENFAQSRFRAEALAAKAKAAALRGDTSRSLGEAGGIVFSVQVGSFTNLENAKGLLQKLISDGQPAYIEESSSVDGISYKVRVGKLDDRSQIEELERRLSQKGYPTKICP